MTARNRPRRSTGPGGRLTRIAGRLAQALDGDPEAGPDLRAVIMLSDDDGRGGMCTSGYASDGEAIADMLSHVQALAEANGVAMHVVPGGVN